MAQRFRDRWSFGADAPAPAVGGGGIWHVQGDGKTRCAPRQFPVPLYQYGSFRTLLSLDHDRTPFKVKAGSKLLRKLIDLRLFVRHIRFQESRMY